MALSHEISSITLLLRFLQSVAAGDPGRLFFGRDAGRSTIHLVWNASDHARYPLCIQEDRREFSPVTLAEQGGNRRRRPGRGNIVIQKPTADTNRDKIVRNKKKENKKQA